jgi:RNA polymerase sigma-70 factor (ECF subfamily)
MQEMIIGKSITFGKDDLNDVASAARVSVDNINEDAEFIERLRAGDEDAFDRLVNEHSGGIYSMLLRLTENAEDAGDLTQETFMNAFRSIGKFRGESSIRTWLYRIAINRSRNRFRWWKSRRRSKTISIDSVRSEEDRPLHETLAGDTPDPEAKAISAERMYRLQETLLTLADIFREAVILRDIEGLTYEEIAEVLDISIGTVKSRIARGRGELARKLEDI